MLLVSSIPNFIYRKQLLFLAIFHGVILAAMVFCVEPGFVQNVGWRNSYLPFVYLIQVVIFFSIWSVTGRWKRSLLWSSITTAMVWLRINQLDGIINIVLLLSFGLVWEYYWKLSKSTTAV